MTLHPFQDFLQKLLPPFTCIFCRTHADRRQDLCSGCLGDLPIVTQKCVRCAQKLSQPGQCCGACLNNPPPFTVYSLFDYVAPIQRLILDLKFHQRLVNARLLGELLLEKIIHDWYQTKPLPTLLIPVPLHPQRLKERGFNQALEIARPISQRLQLKIATQAIQRVKNTAMQTELNAEQRKHNLKNAFQTTSHFTGQHVAMIDDVMTTGSTFSELSRCLLDQGAATIDAWCCARR